VTPAQKYLCAGVLFEREFASGDIRLSLKAKGVRPLLGFPESSSRYDDGSRHSRLVRRSNATDKNGCDHERALDC
jgi:hypothetical protein